MQRIQDATAVAARPATPTLTGVSGFFTNGVPGTVPATDVPDWWLNMMQEELAGVLTFAGLPLDGTATLLQALTGRYLNTQRFLTPGTLTYAPTAGTRLAVYMLQAAGGASAGAPSTGTNQSSAGGAGGGGSYTAGHILISALPSNVVVIGAGGAPTSGGNGGNGGSSAFGGFAVGGGLGGITAGPSGSQYFAATSGAGGTVTVGGEHNAGGNFGLGTTIVANQGIVGLGGAGFVPGYGSGGLGTANAQNAAAVAGVPGQGGALIIVELT